MDFVASCCNDFPFIPLGQEAMGGPMAMFEVGRQERCGSKPGRFILETGWDSRDTNCHYRIYELGPLHQTRERERERRDHLLQRTGLVWLWLPTKCVEMKWHCGHRTFMNELTRVGVFSDDVMLPTVNRLSFFGNRAATQHRLWHTGTGQGHGTAFCPALIRARLLEKRWKLSWRRRFDRKICNCYIIISYHIMSYHIISYHI